VLIGADVTQVATWELAEVQVQQIAMVMLSGAALGVVVLFLELLADEVKVLFMAALVVALAVLVMSDQVQMARLEELTIILEVAGLQEVLAV
jgi:hypothetical protein